MDGPIFADTDANRLVAALNKKTAYCEKIQAGTINHDYDITTFEDSGMKKE